MSDLTRSAAWAALAAHQKTLAKAQMRDLFAQEPGRFDRFSLEAAGLFLDYSRNRITNRTLALLQDLAREAELESWIARLFAGDTVNQTEGRPALHMALRNRANRPIEVNGADVMPEVNAVLARMRDFSTAVRDGSWTGFGGAKITDVVAIGIGGSSLGPHLVVDALAPYAAEGPRLHFVANVDGAEIAATLAGLDPARTLFVVTSKTFTTAETLANARTARAWYLEKGGDAAALDRHFVAVSTNATKIVEFGLDPAKSFAMWDWVGGRYSLWSAVGLPIALAVGFDRFAELLDGAQAMDEHFRTAPPAVNMPVILGLLGVWYGGFFGAASHAVLPYDRRLALLPDFLQQLDMESNGKRVTRIGEAVDYPTGPIVWGGVGTDGQHAFFQLLHQGGRLVPADFIAAVQPHHGLAEHHRMLLANCLAQGEAFMRGRTLAEAKADLAASGASESEQARLAPHMVCPGNQPSNTILVPRLDPHSLGALIALYEHKVFVQSVLWRINPFDQYGVELGKKLASGILAELEAGAASGGRDASTNGLIGRCVEPSARDPSRASVATGV
jgi:glucose-6-phosphate isomerase